MYRGNSNKSQLANSLKPRIYLVYEGRLGSSRADSTYVLENARVFSRFTDVEILVSKRINWTIPSTLKTEFFIRELGKAFNPKTLFQSIRGQVAFGIQVRKYLNRAANARSAIVFHDWWPLQSLHTMFRRRRKYQIVLEVHNQIPRNRLARFLFKHVNLFVATNEPKYLELKECFPGKVILERNCVRLDRYINRPNSPDDLSQLISSFISRFNFVIGYTGSFGDEKNPNLLAELPKHLPDIGFLYVGNIKSQYLSKLMQLPNVLLTGSQSAEYIPSIQAKCNALLISLDKNNLVSRRYTSTMKLMEYVAARKPIIAPRLESIQDLLSEKECYFYTADSVDSCCEAINSIFGEKNQSLELRLPANSRLEELSWERRNKRIFQLLYANL